MTTQTIHDQGTPDVTKFCDALELNGFHGLLLLLGMLTLIFDGYDSQIIAYVMPNIIKEWHLTPLQAGSIASYGLVGLMIGTSGLGMLADRIGRKIPLLLGLFLFSFFGGALYWTHDFKLFCILRFCSGLGIGGVLTLTITVATEFAPAKIRASLVAIMFAGFMVGAALAGVVSMIFVPNYGWRIVLLFAYLPLAFLPVLYLFLPESIRFLAQKGRFDDAIRVLRKIEKSAGVAPQQWTKASFALSFAGSAGLKQLFTPRLAVMTLLVWLVYFFNLLVIYGVTTWLPTLLVASGIPASRSYIYTSLNHIGGAAGTIAIGFLMDRFGRKPSLVYSYLLAGLTVSLFGVISASPVGLSMLIATAGFFVNGAQSAQHAVVGEIYPTFVRSTGVGWALTMGRFGAVCGPLLGGWIQSKNYSFNHYFLLFAVPCVLCALVVCFYRVNVKGEALETVEMKIRD